MAWRLKCLAASITVIFYFFSGSVRNFVSNTGRVLKTTDIERKSEGKEVWFYRQDDHGGLGTRHGAVEKRKSPKISCKWSVSKSFFFKWKENLSAYSSLMTNSARVYRLSPTPLEFLNFSKKNSGSFFFLTFAHFCSLLLTEFWSLKSLRRCELNLINQLSM